MSSNALDLAAQGIAAGTEISVAVIATDGSADSAPLSVGPVRVSGATTSWRQLLPNRLVSREWEALFSVYDAPNRRFVYFHEGALFELALEPRKRWARLPVSGTGPSSPTSLAVLDRARDRVVVIGVYSLENDVVDGEVWALSLTRGGDLDEAL